MAENSRYENKERGVRAGVTLRTVLLSAAVGAVTLLATARGVQLTAPALSTEFRAKVHDASGDSDVHLPAGEIINLTLHE